MTMLIFKIFFKNLPAWVGSVSEHTPSEIVETSENELEVCNIFYTVSTEIYSQNSS